MAEPLGLPPVPIPPDNPPSASKITLGEKLFNDTRFSSTGEVSCSTCHDAAYMKSQFWDGREPDLEGQSKGPLINPVELALDDPKMIALQAYMAHERRNVKMAPGMH